MRKTPSWLERAAQRSSAHPWALGCVLDEFGRIEGMTREQIADFLGCDLEALQWLALCRRPNTDEFANDIRRIAQCFEVEAYKLAELIRRTEAVTVLSRANSEEEALLLAARDRDEEKNS